MLIAKIQQNYTNTSQNKLPMGSTNAVPIKVSSSAPALLSNACYKDFNIAFGRDAKHIKRATELRLTPQEERQALAEYVSKYLEGHPRMDTSRFIIKCCTTGTMRKEHRERIHDFSNARKIVEGLQNRYKLVSINALEDPNDIAVEVWGAICESCETKAKNLVELLYVIDKMDDFMIHPDRDTKLIEALDENDACAAPVLALMKKFADRELKKPVK